MASPSIYVLSGLISLLLNGQVVLATEVESTQHSAVHNKIDRIMQKVEKTEANYQANLKKFLYNQDRVTNADSKREKVKNWSKNKFSHCPNPYERHPVVKELWRSPLRGVTTSFLITNACVSAITVPSGAVIGGIIGVPSAVCRLKPSAILDAGLCGAFVGIGTGFAVGAGVGAPLGLIWGTASMPFVMVGRKIDGHFNPSFYSLTNKIYKAHKKISLIETASREDRKYKKKQLKKLSKKFHDHFEQSRFKVQHHLNEKVIDQFATK